METISRRIRNGRRWASVLCAGGLLACLAGCGDNVIGPQNQLEVTSATDNFQWQASNLDNVTQTLSYTWPMTGTTADVNQSSSVTKGTATVTVRAADGALVYTGDLRQNGTLQSQAGPAGTWSIQLVLKGVSGTVNFRVQKHL